MSKLKKIYPKIIKINKIDVESHNHSIINYQKTEHKLLLQPFLIPNDYNAILSVLNIVKPKSVLEWGIGGSTITFSELKFIHTWHGIEHDIKWHNKIKQLANKKVILYLETKWDKYIKLPIIKDIKPNLIIIDGRERVKCMKTALEICANNNTLIILHDCDRDKYKNGINLFKFKKQLTYGNNDGCGVMLLSQHLSKVFFKKIVDK